MNKQTSQKKTAGIVIAVAAVCIVAAVACWFLFGPKGQAGDKDLTIHVTHSDGSVKTFELSTDAEFLYDAQAEEGILQGEQGEYGLFVTTVDGETADSDAGEYWMYDINGEMAQYGVDTQPVADGDDIEFYIEAYAG